MKILIVVFLVLIYIPAYCQLSDQIKDSIFLNVKNECKGNFHEKYCNKFLKLAEEKIKRDSLVLPQYKFGLKSSETYLRVLKNRYGIIDWNYIEGDVIVQESACFDDYMYVAIEAKYGKGFLLNQQKIADSLDKSGLGYTEPRFNGSNEFLNNFISKSMNIDSLSLIRPLSKFIIFDIAKDGKILNLIVLEGPVTAKQLSSVDSLQLQLNRIFKQSPKWIPAYFFGVPIQSKYVFELI